MCRVPGTSTASLIPGLSGVHVPGTWMGKGMEGVEFMDGRMIGFHLGWAGFDSSCCSKPGRTCDGIKRRSRRIAVGHLETDHSRMLNDYGARSHKGIQGPLLLEEAVDCARASAGMPDISLGAESFPSPHGAAVIQSSGFGTGQWVTCPSERYAWNPVQCIRKHATADSLRCPTDSRTLSFAPGSLLADAGWTLNLVCQGTWPGQG